MVTNISSFFRKKHSALEDKVTEAQTQQKTLKAKIAAVTADRTNLENKRNGEQSFLKQAESKGLDTAKLAADIQKIDNDIAAKTEEIAAIQKEHDAVVVPTLDEKKLKREQRLAELLEVLKMSDASEVESIDDAISRLTVQIAKRDGAGRPIQCSVTFDTTLDTSLVIKPSDTHFLKSFRPELLAWLPSFPEITTTAPDKNEEHVAQVAASAAATEAKCKVFIDRKLQSVVIPQSPLRWRTKNPKYEAYYGRESDRPSEYIDVEDKFEDVALSLSARIDELTKQAGGAFDLNADYADNPLGTLLKSRIQPWTTSNPQFKPCKDRPDSVTIYKTIKSEWDAFVAAPWSEEITGTWALLKYYLENGERARFWAWGFENFYGFRLRTRDHDWIKGKLFIASHLTPAVPKECIAFSKERYGSEIVGKIGRMYLQVDSSASRD